MPSPIPAANTTIIHNPALPLSAREKKWMLYDAGNSAFVLLTTSVAPIYVNTLLKNAGQSNIVSTWGYAQTIASLIAAILMPILGAMADIEGMKIKFFIGFTGTAIVSCFALGLPLPWLAFVVLYIIARTCLNASMTFYDSMLIDTTGPQRMDKISAYGYAVGYIGSTIPFLTSLALIMLGPKVLGISTSLGVQLSFMLTACWWLAFTVPLVRSFVQHHYRLPATETHTAILTTFHELGHTMRTIASHRNLLLFMIAYFFYIDAVNTVISMSTSYGESLGLNSTMMVLALLVTQFVAFPSAIAYGKLAGRIGAKRMITASVAAYVGIVLFAALFMRSTIEFWILAFLVGLFMGGIQALSRSYYGRLIPKERANEYYGFFDIFGRTASILGTLMVAVITSFTGNSSLGVLSIAVLLILALIVLLIQRDPTDIA